MRHLFQFPLPASTDESFSRNTIERLTFLFLLFGVIIRLVRYLLRFPLNGDETSIAYQISNRSFSDLVAPLDYGQTAPSLWLWAQKAILYFFDFHEYSLRLLPLLAAILSLILFYLLAKRLLQGLAVPLAVGIFAVSYHLIKQGAMVKPYSGDVLFSVALLLLTVAYLQEKKTKWYAGLIALTPIAVGMSYPVVFIGGAISLVILFNMDRSHIKRDITVWSCYNVVLISSFFFFLTFFAQSQVSHTMGWFQEIWKHTFPPSFTNPIDVLVWFITSNTGVMFAQPVGGDNGGSTLTFLSCLFAMCILLRKKEWSILLLFLAPFALNLIAASLHRYPYGGMPRFAIYLAPLICILAAYVIHQLLHFLHRQPSKQYRTTVAIFTLLSLIGVLTITRDFFKPYSDYDEIQLRAFSTWFWPGASISGNTVSVNIDPGLDIADFRVAKYLCYRKIALRKAQPEKEEVLRATPAPDQVQFVYYRFVRSDLNAFNQWLEKTKEQYDILGHDSFPLEYKHSKNKMDIFSSIDIYKCRAKGNR